MDEEMRKYIKYDANVTATWMSFMAAIISFSIGIATENIYPFVVGISLILLVTYQSYKLEQMKPENW